MNNTHIPTTVTGGFRFNNPQDSESIRPSANRSVPVYKSTQVVHISERELEEKVNAGHKQASHPRRT